MDDKEFERQAANVLTWIDTALEASGVDVDVEQVASGVLELVFADDSKMIVNRHAAAREIWVAARSGGFHFRVADGAWRDTHCRLRGPVVSQLQLVFAEDWHWATRTLLLPAATSGSNCG